MGKQIMGCNQREHIRIASLTMAIFLIAESATIQCAYARAEMPLGAVDVAKGSSRKSSVRKEKNPMAASFESTMEEGRTLFSSGQYMAALGKFMTVLRQDPQNTEARKYLRDTIDVMRQKPQEAAVGKPGQATGIVQQELRQRLQKRALLTMDLQAIPEVTIRSGTQAAIEIKSDSLFPEKSGGLKEQGIPILDRVVAWLQTFPDQPVIIHCYPEELQEPSSNGGLFLQRFAALYSFFADERKMPAARFVSADLLTDDKKKNTDSSEANATPHVVIETIGASAAINPQMNDLSASVEKTKWIEFSIFSSRNEFDPLEGEWATVDIAALTRKGLASWNLKINNNKTNKTVFFQEGKGNVLRRISWDGRDQSGSFVSPGVYTANLTVTDAETATKNEKVALLVKGAGFKSLDDQALHPAKNSRPKKSAAKKKSKKASANSDVLQGPPDKAPLTPSEPAPAMSNAPAASNAPAVASPAMPTPETGSSVAATPEPASGGSRAIWKQVVQFESGDASINAGVKGSLERIGKTLEVYPLQKVRIVGYANASEPNATQLAKKRAQAVRNALVTDYKLKADRVVVGAGKVLKDASAQKVEISITN